MNPPASVHATSTGRATSWRNLLVIAAISLPLPVIRAFVPAQSFLHGHQIRDDVIISSNARIGSFRRLQMTKPIDIDYDNSDDESDDNDDNEDDELSPPILPFLLDDEGMESIATSEAARLSRSQLRSLTVSELKQQLRLRGKKVTGNKAELVDRLLGLEGRPAMSIGMSLDDDSGEVGTVGTKIGTETAAMASANGKAKRNEKEDGGAAPDNTGPVDVSAYLDEKEQNQAFRSSDGSSAASQNTSEDTDAAEDDDTNESSSSSPEVWGIEAKIVDDYEGRSVVVDSLSRTVVQYTGYNATKTQAYVVASRSALRNFLLGGNESEATPGMYLSPEERVKEMQLKREEEEARVTPKDFVDVDLPNDGDETGAYAKILERDYGDWGVYSQTGAQLSAQEVQGVLLLSDVRGCFHEDTEALADKIAFECQPIVMMAPDLFRGRPWRVDSDKSASGVERNSIGETYEEWRSNHPDERVNVDIRAAAATLRTKYGVSSVSVFGTCYGGGRALEAAAGWSPGTDAEDASSSSLPPPPPVDPSACIAWYPTRYNAKELFGSDRITDEGDPNSLAIMAVFAEEDEIAGATPQDAELLLSCLEGDSRVKDRMVKVFPGQAHGFAHVGMGKPVDVQVGGDDEGFIDGEFGSGGLQPSLVRDDGDAEIASLLSTAWMETYGRKFLPTTGVAVKDDTDNAAWAQSLEMPDLSEAADRDVRAELEDAIKEHVDDEPDLSRMPSYQYDNQAAQAEGLDADLPQSEEDPRPEWDVHLREAAEDLERLNLLGNADMSPEEQISRIQEAASRGELKSFLGRIDELPDDIGAPDESLQKEIDSYMSSDIDRELASIGLDDDDDLATIAKKFREARAAGKLKGIETLKQNRAKFREKRKANVEQFYREQLASIGVDIDTDSKEEAFRKVKEAIDSGVLTSAGVVKGDANRLKNTFNEEEGLW